MKRKDIQISILVIICILLNFIGKGVAASVGLPVWFDCVGTAISATLLGPFCGAVVGVASNIVYGFQDATSFAYALTSAAIGVAIGICAKKKMFGNFFDALTVGFIVTIISILISTPLNCFLYGGTLGNAWGDGIFYMLQNWNVNWVVSAFIAEFFIEFLDKSLIIIFVFMFIGERIEIREETHIANEYKEKFDKISMFFVAFAISALFLTQTLEAGQVVVDYNAYTQTIYDKNNGLLSGEANDITATQDGVLWIGTYAGLYRYNGQEFQYINDWPEVKNVNCLYTDQEGRLWIGTNDSGVAICINDEVVNVLDDEIGMPSNSIRCITQQSNGNFFIGTSGELAVVSLSCGMKVTETIPEIDYALDISADDNNHIAVATATGEFYLLDGTEIVTHMKPAEDGNYTSCYFGDDNRLYVGTDRGRIFSYYLLENELVPKKYINCKDLGAVNRIMQTERGDYFVCGENGIAFLDNGYVCRYMNTGAFRSSVEQIAEDYQGNLWFASSRLGVMKMCESPFTELFVEAGVEESVVNTVCKWQDTIYVGTDSGLVMIDKRHQKVLKSKLISRLEGVRIRSIMTDSTDSLWIFSYGNDGVLKVSPNGMIRTFTAKDKMAGGKFRCGLELADGTMAVSGELGISFIKNGKVAFTITEEDGLANPIVLDMALLADGTILAATDGDGIYFIKDGKIGKHIGKVDGLGSDVILRVINDPQNDAVYFVASNGIGYIDKPTGVCEACQFTEFPYGNNYEIYDNAQGTVFVTSSAGIYVVEKESLLSREHIEYELLNHLSGLDKALVANARNFVDQENVWYLGNSAGVTCLDLNQYQAKTRSYRMKLKAIEIDGVSHQIDRSVDTIIPRGARRIVFHPEIINYSTKDPYVSYCLEGLDENPVVVRQSELSEIVYTSVPAGGYRFVLSILSDDQQSSMEEHVYGIQKEKEIYDNWWFRLYFFVELVLIIAWITWYITRKRMQKTLMIQQKEIKLAKEQIQMGNQTILAIAKAVDAKDTNTSQHSTRVSEYSVMIARRIGYSEEKVENLRRAALLHDIGKIGIPDSVLNKPARLTDEEYALMKSHVTIGGEILKDFTLIDDVQLGAMYHHERYDGKGYMSGLEGEEIPEMARIIGIADAFDAMTANRVYRKQLDFDFVLSELEKGKGTQFDPYLVDIMLELIEDGEISIEELYKGVKA